MVVGGEGKIESGKFASDRRGLEANFVEVVLVFEEGEVVVEGFDFLKIPSVVKEKAVRKSVLKAVGGEVW